MNRRMIEVEHWPVYEFTDHDDYGFALTVEVDGEFIARYRNAKSEWRAVQRTMGKLYEDAERKAARDSVVEQFKEGAKNAVS